MNELTKIGLNYIVDAGKLDPKEKEKILPITDEEAVELDDMSFDEVKAFLEARI